MDTLKAMRVFAAVADVGSFAAAAERLGTSRASVTRHVALLERHLGVRLLQRSTRRLALTEAGNAYRERCEQILNWVDEAEAAVGSGQRAPQGTLRVSAPVSFGVRYLAPAVTAFLARFENIEIDLVLSDRRVNLVEEGFDVAVRIATYLEPGLVARRLSSSRLRVCAARTYLQRHGEPSEPVALKAHHCLLYTHSPQNVWRFKRSGQIYNVAVSGRLRANSGGALLAAAQEGLGLILQPAFIVDEAIAAGRLHPVLRDYDPGEIGIYAVYASRKFLPPKVRTFVDFLARHLTNG